MITTIVILSIVFVVGLAYVAVKKIRKGMENATKVKKVLKLFTVEDLELLAGKKSLSDARVPIVRSFTFTIHNLAPNAKDLIIALLPSYFTKASEVYHKRKPVDVILKEGKVIDTIDQEVLANGKPSPIDDFLKFIKSTRIHITGIKIALNNPDQFENEIFIKQYTPFDDLGYKTIIPANYQNSMQNNNKIVEIPHDFYIDGTTSITTTIKAGCAITYTFFYSY